MSQRSRPSTPSLRAACALLALLAAACGSTASRTGGNAGAGGNVNGGGAGAGGMDAGPPSFGGFEPSGGTRARPTGGETAQGGEGQGGTNPGQDWPELGCDFGTWDADADEATPCVAWTNCEPGQFVSNTPSLSEDRTCANCAAGSFSAHENSLSCRLFSVCGAGSSELTAPTPESDRECSCLNGGSLVHLANGRAACSCPAGFWGKSCGVGTLAVSVDWQSCALRSDHTVACWGSDSDGAVLYPEGEFSSISVGSYYNCGILLDGTVSCWGNEGPGELPTGTFTQVSAGDYACGIRSSGALACWFVGDEGWSEPPSGTFQSISAGGFQSCAVETDGDLVCWGEQDAEGWPSPPTTGEWSSLGEQRYGSCALSVTGTPTCWGQASDYATELADHGALTAVAVGGEVVCGLLSTGLLTCEGHLPSGTYASIDAGSQHICGLKTNGELVCGGSLNYVGAATPVSSAFSDVLAGEVGACGLKTSGAIECWGAGNQLAQHAPAGEFVSLAGSQQLFCALRDDGSAACFGPAGGVPAELTGPFVSVAVGHRHVVGIGVDRMLAVWGDSDAGRLTPPPGEYLSAAAGFYNSCAIRSDGRVLCWAGGGVVRLEPPDGVFTSVSLGYDPNAPSLEYACGIRGDGTLSCWGRGVGAGTEAPPEGTFASVTTSGLYACALRLDGSRECWGPSIGPLPDSALQLTKLALAARHSCGLTEEGRVECRGQLLRPLQ